MMIFSKLSNSPSQNASNLLKLRQKMALYPRLNLDEQSQIHLKLMNLAQNNRDILMIGDLLMTVYPSLNLEQKSELYHRIISLSNHFDFHLRQHSLILMTSLIKNEQLTPAQQREANEKIISLCGDRNIDIKYRALNFMLKFFPRLHIEGKNALYLGIQQDCQDLLDTEIREFAKRFFNENFEYLTREQQESPLYSKFDNKKPNKL